MRKSGVEVWGGLSILSFDLFHACAGCEGKLEWAELCLLLDVARCGVYEGVSKELQA